MASRWWRRSQRCRTLAGLALELILGDSQPLYQLIASEAAALRAAGARVSAIARRLRVDSHTVDKALRWLSQP